MVAHRQVFFAIIEIAGIRSNVTGHFHEVIYMCLVQ